MGLCLIAFQEPRLINGRSGGARTPNPRFWRPVLYQLSYTPNLHRHSGRDPGAHAMRPTSRWIARSSPATTFTALLFYDFGDDAGADGAAAFADRKAQAFVHRDRRDQLDLHRDVVARHHHLGAFRQMHGAGHIGGAEIELRPVVAEKRRVPPAFLLGQDVGLALKAGVRSDRPRRRQHLAALDLLALGAAQQRPDIVARLALIQEFAEHLDPGHHRLGGWSEPDDLDLVADLDDAALDPPRHQRAAPRAREHVLDRHQKRPVLRPLRLRDV